MADEVLKRRLTGAAVLLLAAFALASLLPEAPRERAAARGERVVAYDLRTGLPVEPGQAPARPDGQAAAAPEPRPGPGAGRASAPEPPATRSRSAEPRGAVKLQESVALSPVPSWYVQVGSFESQANARSVVAKLYELGMPPTIQSVQVNKNLWYRVRVGPYATESKAREAHAKIRQQGYKGAKVINTGTQ